MGRAFGTVLVGLAVAACLSGCRTATTADPGSVPVSITPTTASIERGRFHSTALTGDAALAEDVAANPTELWFEQQNGRLTMIAAGPVNTANVPISITGTEFQPDGEVAVTSAGCAGESPRCTVDAWFTRFVGHRLTVVTDGDRLRLSDGTVALTMQRE